MKKLFIITGEHSGDLHASFVVKAIKKMMPGIEIQAVGGKNLEKEGVKLFKDHSKMGVVGISLSAIVDHLKLGKEIINHLKNDFKPDLVLLVDYGGFNLRIAKELKKNNLEAFYYISPQVWASRKNRVNSIKKYISRMMVILPFEEKFHKTEGINAQYVGHPLISQLPKDFSKEEFIKINNLDPNKKIVGVFPGSRKMELNYLLPVFIKAIELINKHSKKVQFCLGQAPNVNDKLLSKYLKGCYENDIDLKILKNQNHALLACSDVVMLASGTITLEAAIYKTPMIVSYKGPSWAYTIYMFLRYLSILSLPNIIAGKKIVQEFLQNNAKPNLIADEVLSLLHNENKRNEMINELEIVNQKLGDKIASNEVADIIKNYLENNGQ